MSVYRLPPRPQVSALDYGRARTRSDVRQSRIRQMSHLDLLAYVNRHFELSHPVQVARMSRDRLITLIEELP